MKRESHVFVYSAVPPDLTGSGAQVRVFSNIQAYLDIGMKATLVLTGRQPHDASIIDRLPGLQVRSINQVSAHRPSLLSRVANRLGYPPRLLAEYRYPWRRALSGHAMNNESEVPGSIHHFEYLYNAVAALGAGNLRSIYSMLDLGFARERMLCSAKKGKKAEGPTEARKIRNLERTERFVAQSCDLVLSIADHEHHFIQEEWGINNSVLLPMSWPGDGPFNPSRCYCKGGVLRVLHLGGARSYVAYSSLVFFLREVLPRIPAVERSRLRIDVVGEVGDDERGREVTRLSELHDEVRLHGYQGDLAPFFGKSDLQVVCLEAASGLRTRIIESFAKGLPVLSTTSGARGVVGLQDGRNIFLEDSADGFARRIVWLLRSPQALASAARLARATYEEFYSRSKAASVLSSALRGILPERDQYPVLARPPKPCGQESIASPGK